MIHWFEIVINTLEPSHQLVWASGVFYSSRDGLVLSPIVFIRPPFGHLLISFEIILSSLAGFLDSGNVIICVSYHNRLLVSGFVLVRLH